MMGFFNFFRKKKKAPSYYKNYREQPYISPDRDMKDWNEKANLFPKMLVQDEMMTRNEDGLLPGHVYMLYWLNRYTNKRVPVYFEYKYGLDFEKEVMFLQKENLLDEQRKATEKGRAIIDKYYSVIESHKNANKKKTEDEIYNDAISSTHSQINSAIAYGAKQYVFIASPDSCSICKELDDKIFDVSQYKIGVNAPPMHKKCRCSISSYIDRDEFERDLKRRGL